MKELRLFQVDAFTKNLFTGNPAAVCPLDKWLSDELMQKIAMENNLSETAFFVATPTGFHLRWFTPIQEVHLCGHATLAAAHVLFESLGYSKSTIEFQTLSGVLTVSKKSQLLEMDFPSQELVPVDAPAALLEAFAMPSGKCLKGMDYVLILETEQHVQAAKPKMDKLCALELRGVAITSRGNDCDYVCRFFAPKFGIPEDPVTGSLQTVLAPYWASLLGKNELYARQISTRGGEFHLKIAGDRILISGEAKLYLDGKISIP